MFFIYMIGYFVAIIVILPILIFRNFGIGILIFLPYAIIGFFVEYYYEYINTFPKDIQNILQKVRQTISMAASEAIESVNYQMPTFKLNGKNLGSFCLNIMFNKICHQ